MNIIRQWFYSSTLYYKFRYYFIRHKAPISYIFWSEILRRENISQGNYSISLAWIDGPDASIWIERKPRDSGMSITVQDSEGNSVDTVWIPLSYRTMGKIFNGFNKASSISYKNIKEENEVNYGLIR